MKGRFLPSWKMVYGVCVPTVLYDVAIDLRSSDTILCHCLYLFLEEIVTQPLQTEKYVP